MKVKFYCILFISLMYGLINFQSCQSGQDIKTAQYAVNGQKVYNTHCSNCHGPNGEGLGELYPPLTDKNFLEKHRSKLACYVRNGMQEEIEVAGKKFNNIMPSNESLTEIDIADVLTNISTRFAKQDKIFSLEEVQTHLKSCP